MYVRNRVNRAYYIKGVQYARQRNNRTMDTRAKQKHISNNVQKRIQSTNKNNKVRGNK